MEIPDCTSVAFDSELPSVESTLKIPVKAPNGLASISDSIDKPSGAPKPSLLWRIALSALLFFSHCILLNIHLLSWLLEIFGLSNRQKFLYQELHALSKLSDAGKIREFLIEHSKNPEAIGYLFSEFLDLPELHPHFSEILQGANICLEGDYGFFCRRWSEHPDCYKRLSSHKYQGDDCYALDHIVFWIDFEGNTRLQFENSPLSGFLNSIYHLIDFFRYRRDNEQQGVIGSSAHTEDYCVRVPVDPLGFMSRKVPVSF